MAHGIFDVDTFLTIFYDCDVFEEHPEEDLMEVVEHSLVASYIAQNKETFHAANIFAFKDKADINLLHEEIHYWQAMTSPVTILNYLNITKLLRCRVDELNLRRIVSDTFPFEENNLSDCLYVYRSHKMNFESPKQGRDLFRSVYSLYKKHQENGYQGSWKEFTQALRHNIENKEGKSIYVINAPYLNLEKDAYNVVSENPPLAMPFITVPHLQEGYGFLEYAGILDFFDTVYFTGDNLMEAFAMVNEYVSKGVPIPEYDPSKGEANRYLGAYEVYRRMHGSRYQNERELAISFLALVDICFTTDPLHNHDEDFTNDNDFRNENVSIPYRFGKLIFRAQGFRPFSISSESSIIEDIEKWQDDFCQYQGLFLPELCIKHTIEELLMILVCDLDGIGYEFSEDSIKVFSTLQAEHPGWEEKFSLAVDELNRGFKWMIDNKDNGDGVVTLQSHMILAIANAMYFKLHNRGKVIISALYSDEIRWRIEPATYIVGGRYAYNYLSAIRREPLNDYSLGVFSSLENMVVKSIAKTGKLSCGFKDSFFPCRFTANGYGCPLVGLTSSERELRRRHGYPEDWCHYKRMMNTLIRN